MIKLSPFEVRALHDSNRQEYFKAELTDRYSIRKCDLALIDGEITCSSNADIQKYGSISFSELVAYRKTQIVAPATTVLLKSSSGKIFELGITPVGEFYHFPIIQVVEAINSNIKINDEADLYTEGITQPSKEFELIDSEGIVWQVGIEANGDIYAENDNRRKLYYRNEKIDINYLSDRVKLYFGIRIGTKIRWWPLGVFLMIKPAKKNEIITTQILDETTLVQQARYLEPKLLPQGRNYVEALNSILVSCGITKINIEPTTLTLQADIILDDSKTKLEWFNYLAEQINYNKLSVNADGWFVSNKYVEPSPLNATYIYKANQMGVLVGEADITMDFWQVPNVFKRTVSHPKLGVMSSKYINDNPTDPFSTVNRGEICDFSIVDNIGSQVELDNLTKKVAFQTRQVTQDVVFATLPMPHHQSNDILDLRHRDINGIFTESEWSIRLKAGELMQHKARRLVTL